MRHALLNPIAAALAGIVLGAAGLALAGRPAEGPHPVAATAASARHASLPDELPGPVPAMPVRVIDGDTVVVRAAVWVGQSVEVAVRLRGIDAPELRAGCAAEKAMARRARAWVENAAGKGPVVLTRISGGKFFGRVVADMAAADGTSMGPGLLAAGLARPYAGGRREGWCGGAQ